MICSWIGRRSLRRERERAAAPLADGRFLAWGDRIDFAVAFPKPNRYSTRPLDRAIACFAGAKPRGRRVRAAAAKRGTVHGGQSVAQPHFERRTPDARTGGRRSAGSRGVAGRASRGVDAQRQRRRGRARRWLALSPRSGGGAVRRLVVSGTRPRRGRAIGCRRTIQLASARSRRRSLRIDAVHRFLRKRSLLAAPPRRRGCIEKMLFSWRIRQVSGLNDVEGRTVVGVAHPCRLENVSFGQHTLLSTHRRTPTIK